MRVNYLTNHFVWQVFIQVFIIFCLISNANANISKFGYKVQVPEVRTHKYDLPVQIENGMPYLIKTDEQGNPVKQALVTDPIMRHDGVMPVVPDFSAGNAASNEFNAKQVQVNQRQDVSKDGVISAKSQDKDNKIVQPPPSNDGVNTQSSGSYNTNVTFTGKGGGDQKSRIVIGNDNVFDETGNSKKSQDSSVKVITPSTSNTMINIKVPDDAQFKIIKFPADEAPARKSKKLKSIQLQDSLVDKNDSGDADENILPSFKSNLRVNWQFQIMPPNIGQKIYIDSNTHLPPVSFQYERDIDAFRYVERSNDNHILRAMIEKMSNINIQDQHGNTLLMHSVMYANHDALTLLLHHGANSDIMNDAGFGVLHLAAHFGDDIAVAILVHNNTNVDAVDVHGNTAIMYAAASGSIDIVRRLMHEGAKLDVVNKKGLTALDFAASGNNDIVSKFFHDIRIFSAKR